MTTGRKPGNAKIGVTGKSWDLGVMEVKMGTKVSFYYNYIFVIGFLKLALNFFVNKQFKKVN